MLFDFFERDADEGTLLPEWVGKSERRRGAGELIAGVVIRLDEVDVDSTVGIDRWR